MTIKTFEEWYGSGHEHEELASYVQDAYLCGIKEATTHFEEEKIRIHEYYAAKLAELFEQEQFKGSEENSGKLE